MSTEQEKLQNFLNALDAIVQDYKCGYCSELLKDPVTLSTCFHYVCSSHFEILTECPTCKIPLTNCTTFKEDGLETCINSTKELDRIFQGLRKNVSQTEKIKSGTIKKPRKTPSETYTPPDAIASAGTSHVKSNLKHDLNSTLRSSASSNLNKGNEKRNKKGETQLHIACRLGKFVTVVNLLNAGANTNTKDNAGWTPLHEVVQNGNLDIVKLLLEHNTLIDVPGQGNETPLHEAVRYNYKDIAVELVRNGANVNARNCKGETPALLASEEMRSALEQAQGAVLQTQSLNATRLSELESDNAVLYCPSASRSVQSKLRALAKGRTNVTLEQKFTKGVTHLIVDTDENYVCTSSLDVLQGIVNSIWIISTNWITASTAETLQRFEDHEVLGVGTKTHGGPRGSRHNKYKQLPGLFNGCHFYLHNFNLKYEVSRTIVLNKAILGKLITDAGGTVLRRVPNPELIPAQERLVPYHALEGGKLSNCSHYIIFKDMYEPMYNMSHIKALPVGWLIECIEKYQLCETW